MASKKLTDLPLLDEAPADNDQLLVEDTSAAITKRTTVARLRQGRAQGLFHFWSEDFGGFGAVGTPYFVNLGGHSMIGTPSAVPIRHYLPAGTHSTLRLHGTSGPAGGTVTVTVYKNGVATALTASVAIASTDADDLTHSFTTADGDYIDLATIDGAGFTVPGSAWSASWLFTPAP